MMHHKIGRTARIVTLAAAACALLGGCGGGGGTGSPNRTLSGTLQDSSGQALTGYRVVFDGPSQYATTTGSGGAFRLVVPNSAVTAQDTFSIYDDAGALADIEAVQVDKGGVNVYKLPAVGPPTQPAGL